MEDIGAQFVDQSAQMGGVGTTQLLIRRHDQGQQPVVRHAVDNLGIRRAQVSVRDGVAESCDDSGVPTEVALRAGDALRANRGAGLGERKRVGHHMEQSKTPGTRHTRSALGGRSANDGLSEDRELASGRPHGSTTARILWLATGRVAESACEHVDRDVAGGSLGAAGRDHGQGGTCIGVAVTRNRAIDERGGVIRWGSADPGDCALQGGAPAGRVLGESAQGS